MWFKVDDNLATHPKVLRAGNAAMGLWVRAGSWCGQHLTDGFVAAEALTMIGSLEQAETLVEVGLWDEVEGGYQFHQWEERQPSKASTEQRREAERQRKAEWRAEQAKKRESQRDKNGTDASVAPDATRDTTRESALPDPTRPDPTISTYVDIENESGTADAARPDVEQLLDLLDEELTKNGVKKLPARNKKNHDAIRLMLDRDQIPLEQIAGAIRWAQADEFWRSNILSASKLREKYETLRAQASRGRRQPAVQDNMARLAQYEAEERAIEQKAVMP